MILFKQEHVRPILKGEKTQTRRVGTKRWNVGSIHQAKTQMLIKSYFARLRILDVRQELLGDITPEDALKEGGYTVEEFIDVFDRINKKTGGWSPDLMVWVVTFELAPIDLKPGDKVTLSPKCVEYHYHGNEIFEIVSDPWFGYNVELIKIKSPETYYASFMVDHLEKVES